MNIAITEQNLETLVGKRLMMSDIRKEYRGDGKYADVEHWFELKIFELSPSKKYARIELTNCSYCKNTDLFWADAAKYIYASKAVICEILPDNDPEKDFFIQITKWDGVKALINKKHITKIEQCKTKDYETMVWSLGCECPSAVKEPISYFEQFLDIKS